MNTICGIRPPLQGLNGFGMMFAGVAPSQGVALGYHSARRWRFLACTEGA